MSGKLKKLPRNRPIENLPLGGITANILRLIAILLMISDHVWATFMSFGNWMTYLGRLAFPIFAFQLAEGFVHTKNVKKYALRLGIFALISELPFNLFYSSRWFNPYHQNVLFTFLLGLAAMVVLDKMKKDRTAKTIGLGVLFLVLIGVASVITFPDYGFTGFITILLFYICRDFPFAWLAQLVGMVLIHIVFFEGQVLPFELFGHAFEFPTQGFAVLALLPIWAYGGKKGRSNKFIQYGSYGFYPVHMIILYLIRYFA
ncbi:MAG: conjugal transfer protein TraX [Ruminococcaceae bacterium]|nr:conjugal transfer protein TraX [Oscillospiraceae bacterium]